MYKREFNLSSNSLDYNVMKGKDYSKSIIQISDDEIKKHKDFLKTELKKNYYWTFLLLYKFSKSTVSLILTSLKPEFSNKKVKICLNSG